jgi:cytochrome c553
MMSPRYPSSLVFSFFLGISAAWAAETAKADPAKAQQIATQVCAACHGADGNSAIPANPNLAAQIPEYTAKQLANFKGGERSNAVMSGIASTLSPEDMTSLGAYFANQAAKPGTATDKELVALGQSLYRGGNSGTGVPACAACHSPNGAGIPKQYPRLSGQHAAYTIAQLKAFRAGERANDPNRMMRMIAAKMSEREMQAVAEFIAGLR